MRIPDLALRDEGVTALSGPSGSGKSSILRVLLGIDTCRDMTWQFGAIEMHKLTPPDRHIGVVFQAYELFPHLTGYANVEFAARARKMSPKDFTARWNTFAKALSLESFAQRRADKLSGGEKQRIALARALITKPRFLFLDEPFANLDLPLRAAARALVAELIHAEQIPTVLVTHDPLDLQSLANQVHEIREGSLAL